MQDARMYYSISYTELHHKRFSIVERILLQSVAKIDLGKEMTNADFDSCRHADNKPHISPFFATNHAAACNHKIRKVNVRQQSSLLLLASNFERRNQLSSTTLIIHVVNMPSTRSADSNTSSHLGGHDSLRPGEFSLGLFDPSHDTSRRSSGGISFEASANMFFQELESIVADDAEDPSHDLSLIHI